MSIQRIVIITGVLLGLGYALWAWVCERRRQNRLASRIRLGMEEWVRKFYPDVTITERENIGRTIDIVAESLNVEACLLRPNDRFDSDLALRGFPLDDSMDGAMKQLTRYVNRVSNKKWRPQRQLITLDDLIHEILAATK